MTVLMFILGTISAVAAAFCAGFEIFVIVTKQEKHMIFPLFCVAVLVLTSWGCFSYYAEELAAERLTSFENKKIMCENFVRYGRKKTRGSPVSGTSLTTVMLTVPVRKDGKRGLEFICYVDGNGSVQQAVIRCELQNAAEVTGEPGQPKGSESDKFRVEAVKKKSGKHIVSVTAKKVGTEFLKISSPDSPDTKTIILSSYDENWEASDDREPVQGTEQH